MRDSLSKNLNTVFSRCFGKFVCVIAIVVSISASASELPAPTGEVLLVIDGPIDNTNGEDNGTAVAMFDLALLKSLGATTLNTSTPWSEKSQFTGVLFSELMSRVGIDADDAVIRASAADDYWFDLKDLNTERYPIIVAYEKDGAPLTLRKLGPLWITLPWDDFPELKTETNKASSVWQLTRLTVLSAH